MEDVEKPNVDFDILNWWKVLNQILNTCPTNPRCFGHSHYNGCFRVGFTTRGRVLDPFQSSLAPGTVEGLVCSQNWLRFKPVSSGNGYDSEIVDDAKNYRLESGMHSITHYLIYLAIY
jgi:hypothetical protein